ncbi:MAG: DUF4012 domain-containing protein [Actinomycetota bacterium]|nr:DUF4012 domain-containing protein [Actinomycetota bacterium]
MTRSYRSRRRHRWRVAILIGTGLLIVLGILAAFGLRDALAARNHLVAAKNTLSETAAQTTSLGTAAGRATAARRISVAMHEIVVAGTIVNGSYPLRVARFVPFVDAQRSGLVRLIADAKTALMSTRTLLTDVDRLAANGRVTEARVPLGVLAGLEAEMRTAGTALAGLNRSRAGLAGPLGRARGDFNTLATATAHRLLGDADTLKVALSLMGAGGPRRYFVALENNAEMRDQGAVLSYAVVNFDHGQIQVNQHGSVNAQLEIANTSTNIALHLDHPADIAIPPGTATVFGRTLPTFFWANVDATADFAFSGRAMKAMYQQATGQTVDGVFALDVPALSSLLALVGPVSLPGVSLPLTADNAATVILHDLYEAFPSGSQTVRQEFLSEAVTAVLTRIGAGTFDPVELAQRLATAAAGRHLRAWSDDPGEERLLENDSLGGGPAVAAPEKTFHVAVENRNATKMDYYIRTATQQQIEITRAGTAIVITTVVVHNTAPIGTMASYATGPEGGTTQPAEYWAWVLLWGPSHAMQPGAVPESGLNLSDSVLDRIYAGQTKQATFVTVIPHAVHDGVLQLRFVPQPRLVDPTLDITVKADGRRITGSPTFSGPWNKTITLSWTVHR